MATNRRGFSRAADDSIGYFLDSDAAGRWYRIEASLRQEWDTWKAIPDDDERGWVVPAFAVAIDSPSSIIFMSYKVYGQ